MPVTLTPLLPGAAGLGWDVFVDVQSSIPGPLPVGTRWNLDLSADTDGLQPIMHFQATGQSNPQRLQLSPRGNLSFVSDWSAVVGRNVTAHMQVTLPDNTVYDTGSQVLPWIQTSGDAIATASFVTTTSGGLTPDQAAQLTAIEQATSQQLQTQSGTGLATPIDSLVHLPGLRDLVVQSTTFVMEGRSSIALPAVGGEPFAYGVQLQTTQVAAGMGRREGFITSYEQRVAQLVAIGQELATGEAEFLEVLDFRLDAFTWLFRQFTPVAVGYDVSPSCVVVGRWLVLV